MLFPSIIENLSPLIYFNDIMWSEEKNWGSERGVRFFDSSNVGVNVSVQRIKLLELGLDVVTNLPLCSPSEAADLVEFFPRAKVGFSLALKAEHFSRSQIADLLRITTPHAVMGAWNNLSLTDRENTLPEYAQAIATLSMLHELYNVSFFSFEDPPGDVSYEAGMTQSQWYSSTDHEAIWYMLSKMEVATWRLLHSPTMDSDDMLKAGHYFMASREAAKIFMYD